MKINFVIIFINFILFMLGAVFIFLCIILILRILQKGPKTRLKYVNNHKNMFYKTKNVKNV